MSKRKRKKKSPRFKTGDRVRVKHGAVDRDYPDVPLGGWAGTIRAIGPDGVHCVRWSEETLAAIHPVHKKRCERDGLALEEYWLAQDELEPDPGGPLSIEQPAELNPRSLSVRYLDDRLRMVFDLDGEDRLPPVDEEALETYYDYLAAHLSFPIKATWWESAENSLRRRPQIGSVVRFDRETGWTEEEGILCVVHTADGEDVVPLVDLDLRGLAANRQLIEDYKTWFIANPAYDEDLNDGDSCDEDEGDSWDEGEEEAEHDDSHASDSAVIAMTTWSLFASCVLYGATIGSALATMPGARWAAVYAGGLFAMGAGYLGAKSVRPVSSVLSPWGRRILATLGGLCLGGAGGALIGVLIVAWLGAVLGGILGLAVRTARAKQWPVPRLLPADIWLYMACGATGQAFYMDYFQAVRGGLYGGLAGAAAAVVFFLTVGLLTCLTRRSTSS